MAVNEVNNAVLGLKLGLVSGSHARSGRLQEAQLLEVMHPLRPDLGC